jgi:hypothetical protein
MRQRKLYRHSEAQRNLRHRYIFEDVPCSLVPIALIGFGQADGVGPVAGI